MKRLALFAILCATNLWGGILQDVAPQRGRALPSITWIDESGRSRQLSELAGYPVVLLPIYTRCQTACIQNVRQLERVLADSSIDPTQFRVLLFSFDATDSPSTLASYRSREKIPLSWLIGTATQRDIDALTESIGFQYGRAGAEFAHANLLVILDSRLRIAKWIYGTDYSTRDVDLALKVASGESDWIGQHSDLLYAALLFAGSILCVALCYHVLQLASRRRSSYAQDRPRSIATNHR